MWKLLTFSAPSAVHVVLLAQHTYIKQNTHIQRFKAEFELKQSRGVGYEVM